MNGATFPSPAAEIAEMNRIQYELEYTEGISQRMRIPEMLKVASTTHEDPAVGSQETPHSVIMQVPERIVIAGKFNTLCECSFCVFCAAQSALCHTNYAYQEWLTSFSQPSTDNRQPPLSVLQDFAHHAPRCHFISTFSLLK